MKEKLIYKNKNGKIVMLIDRFGNIAYKLFDANGNYIKDIYGNFCVADYL